MHCSSYIWMHNIDIVTTAFLPYLTEKSKVVSEICVEKVRSTHAKI